METWRRKRMTAANTRREAKETTAETAAGEAQEEEEKEAMAQISIDESKPMLCGSQRNWSFEPLLPRLEGYRGGTWMEKGAERGDTTLSRGRQDISYIFPTPSSPATAAVCCSGCLCVRRCSLMLRISLSSPSLSTFPLPFNFWLPP